jgi:hypothetical protein
VGNEVGLERDETYEFREWVTDAADAARIVERSLLNLNVESRVPDQEARVAGRVGSGDSV